MSSRIAGIPLLGPTILTLPVITGAGELGQVLTVGGYSWSGTGPVTVDIQWFLNDLPVPGAISDSYTLDQAGRVIVGVYATDSLGTRSAWSSEILVEAAPGPQWAFTAGDGSVNITSFPSLSSPWSITAGDGQATINSYPEA